MGALVLFALLFTPSGEVKSIAAIVRDETGYLQVVVPKAEAAPETWGAAERATQETSLRVRGRIREDKRAPGGYELDVTDVQVIQKVPEGDPYPISLKEHGVDFLMEHRHLWVRSKTWDPEGLVSTIPALCSQLFGVLAGSTTLTGGPATGLAFAPFIVALAFLFSLFPPVSVMALVLTG